MKYGFIGAGNMGAALIRGAVRSKMIPPADIEVYDVNSDTLVSLKEELSVDISYQLPRLISDCNAIVLAVKPNVLPYVLSDMAGPLSIKKPLVISIAAGQSLAKLREMIGFDVPLIRVMPNLNAAVGEAISAYCKNELVTDEMVTAALTLLRCSGDALELNEKLFPVFDAIGGAAPAFCFQFADALTRAAVRNGMARADALKISMKVIEGSMRYLRESGEHPWELVDRVCSPGGITIEGVMSLQADGFSDAVARAVDAVIKKDKKL